MSDEEIKKAIFQCHPQKAPAPDGFNAGFFHSNWNTIGDEITKAIKLFFYFGKLIKELNHTFITLVPKTTNASQLNDYKLISCRNVMYKFISKVLSNRLQMVVEELISPNQIAFLKGSDCSLLALEIIREFNKPMGSRAFLKVDLQKAFDSVNSEFVYFIFHCMGFPSTWINWIKECLSSPTFSVMVNGSPAGYFPSNRGIRQEDPLSPYIFVLIMEFWSIHMELAMASGMIHPIKRSPHEHLSHTLFC